MARDPDAIIDEHLTALAAALLPFRRVAGALPRWGGELAWTLGGGGRLLAAGNGGSAAEAQHLTAELVGKLRDDRTPLSAIALNAETSSLTAIGNDFGFAESFARQVRAHGRPDDILLLISTSGRSGNLLSAAAAGRDAGLRVWGFTGPAPNPLANLCDRVLAVPSDDPQVVQELHLLAIHVVCEFVDLALPTVLSVTGGAASPPPGDGHPASTHPSQGHPGQDQPGQGPPSPGHLVSTPATNGHPTNGHPADGHPTEGPSSNGHLGNGHAGEAGRLAVTHRAQR